VFPPPSVQGEVEVTPASAMVEPAITQCCTPSVSTSPLWPALDSPCTTTRDAIPAFCSKYRAGAIALPRDAEVLDDLRAFRLEKGVAKIPEAARSRDARGAHRHGDAGVALALAQYASRQEAIVYESHRASAREDADADPRPRAVRTGAVGFGLQRGLL
jgi:hypothetical protein